jgi:hypothetical protein
MRGPSCGIRSVPFFSIAFFGILVMQMPAGSLAMGVTPGAHDRLGYQYLSPLPGSELHSTEVRIILRPGERLDEASVRSSGWMEVSGSESGVVPGEVYFALDEKTVVFKPCRSFVPGETVQVQVRDGLHSEAGEAVAPIAYCFRVSPKEEPIHLPMEVCYPELMRGAQEKLPAGIGRRMEVDQVVLPTDFPPLEIVVNNNPCEGCLFFAPGVFPYPGSNYGYKVIMDNAGEVIFYHRDQVGFADFKVLCDGSTAYYKGNTHKYFIMDSTYTLVDTFETVGYYTDGHDFVLLENGHALLMAYDPQPVNMSQIVPGGDPNAIVTGLIIQELDVNHEVVFQWRSWDHFEITDATVGIDLTAHQIDYVHGNSVDVDVDGNIIISCRHFDECTKISRTTGEIIWRFGGELCENNQFTIIGDDFNGFSRQHDFRRIESTYTLFDNGNMHTPPIPRAVEYLIDDSAMTATLVWEYRNDSPVWNSHMGSVQRLPNGNTLICWGGSWLGMMGRSITEVSSDTTVEFEMDFGPNRYKSYRAMRQEWHGQAEVPYLVAEPDPESAIVILTYNVFGTVEFETYNIYYDLEPGPTNIMLTTAERQITVSDLCNGYHFFRVTAVDSNGQETGYSNEVKVIVTWSDVEPVTDGQAEGYSLSQNWPNPFNSSTAIRYHLPQESSVNVCIYNVSGQLVNELYRGKQASGYHTMIWDAWDVASGIYFYRIDAGHFCEIKKMVVLR